MYWNWEPLSCSFPLCQGWGAARNFFTASSDSRCHPPLSLVFFFQSSSSPAFLTYRVQLWMAFIVVGTTITKARQFSTYHQYRGKLDSDTNSCQNPYWRPTVYMAVQLFNLCECINDEYNIKMWQLHVSQMLWMDEIMYFLSKCVITI